MKTKNFLLTNLMLISLFVFSAWVQPAPEIIAVINHAEWCPTCRNHGERAGTAFKENNKDGAIHFIVNDVTNDETKAKSSKELKKYGLDKIMEDHKSTGVAYFFNPGTKALITQISVSKSDKELADALDTAKKGVK